MRDIEELYEASNEDLPELYCDMDMVLVDFLKGAEKVVGQPFAKSDNKTRWSKISGTKDQNSMNQRSVRYCWITLCQSKVL